MEAMIWDLCDDTAWDVKTKGVGGVRRWIRDSLRPREVGVPLGWPGGAFDCFCLRL